MHDEYEPLAKPGRCELCGRDINALTKHHLIPRMRHRSKRSRKRFSREEMRARILWVCRPCHKQIHAVLSEKELGDRYNTKQALLAHPDIRQFVDWIQDKPPGFVPRTFAMKRR